MKFGRAPAWLSAVIIAGCLLLACACRKDDFTGDSGWFTDTRDAREYRWIRIGTQIVMAENLDWLPSVYPSAEGSDTLSLYYVYRYEGRTAAEAANTREYRDYGVFYNWTAAMMACPEGWHIPDDGEWDILVNSLGGEYTAGKSMKSGRGWEKFEGNTGNGTNSSGFSGIPAGGRQAAGGFYEKGFNAFFWTSSPSSDHSAWYRYLGYFHNGVYRYFSNVEAGFSVRCIKGG
jgi:uncharacterized protein (TIGR02145 family)